MAEMRWFPRTGTSFLGMCQGMGMHCFLDSAKNLYFLCQTKHLCVLRSQSFLHPRFVVTANYHITSRVSVQTIMNYQIPFSEYLSELWVVVSSQPQHIFKVEFFSQ